MGSPGCLDEQTVVSFVGGQMAAAQRALVEAHLETCSACAELTTWAAAEIAHRSLDSQGQGRPFIGALPPGSRIERYQILGAIGRGGMGEVYAAYHPDLDRRIALKVVRGVGGDSAHRRARLLREARAIARLSHPNVITVHDAGSVDDRVYIAMEFVEGETVDVWLRAAPRGWREVLEVFGAAGRGLAAAHAAGVVHRDFKPQNVMVGHDGLVRVMDFGLARLAEEPVDPPPDAGDEIEERPVTTTTVTKTGALIGTPAYMAPEQSRREPIDARADQFSFCVALHEAIYGRRPTLPHVGAQMGRAEATAAPSAGKTPAAMARTASSPAWLRGVLARGLSEDRDQRFPSMAELLAAMTHAQTRVRRRTAALGVGVAVALLTGGAWRLGAVRSVACAVPRDQLAAVWQTGDESTRPRRQALHRAFIASGLPTAEAAWQRVATALDEYTAQWSAMYVSACEATHVRGDQTAEVLGLRMDCLNESLDGVRALTEVLSRADATMIGQAATAARNLAPIKHCADIPGLRSAVPVPGDDATAGAVAEVRRSLRDAYALFEVGNERAALARARDLLPRAETTRYKPVVAEVLHEIGYMQSDGAPAEAERTFEQALDAAEAARDDLTAAKAAIGLVFVTAIAKEQRHENEQWTKLAHAIVDRLPPPQHRLRGWLLNNEAGVFLQQRRFEEARQLLEQSIALKEEELGKNHPDVVRTNIGLIWALNELGRPAEGLRVADQSLAVLGPLDADSVLLAYTLNNRGDALSALARYGEAERDYQTSLRIMRAQLGESSPVTAVPIVGLGNARLRQGDAEGAVRLLEQALGLQQGAAPDPGAVADTRFALARALAASGRERARARALATAAERTYASEGLEGNQREAAAWLAEH